MTDMNSENPMQFDEVRVDVMTVNEWRGPMTDMTPEQTIEWLDSLHETVAGTNTVTQNKLPEAQAAIKAFRSVLSANGGEAEPFAYFTKSGGQDCFTRDRQLGEVGWPAIGGTVVTRLYTYPAPPPATQNVEWFFYDAENGHIELCETKEEALSKAQKAVDFCFDECWSDEVEQICVGTITHRAKQTNLMFKPQKLDEDMLSEDGEHWPEDCESKCDYSIEPIDPQTQGGGE